MSLPIQLISTDFDGTLFAEFESPPIPEAVQTLIGGLQSRGAKWIINTGRDMSSLMEALGRARISVEPDYLVLVEREIHCHVNSQYVGLEEWNAACIRAHAELLYEDAYSPFCLVAGNNGDANAIHEYLNEYAHSIPHLTVVRNDVYARFGHEAFNKGTSLAEITRRLGLNPEVVFAAGDWLNDLPMLSRRYARWLAAPDNAVEAVKQAVRQQEGFVSKLSHGEGVVEGLEYCLVNAKRAQESRA